MKDYKSIVEDILRKAKKREPLSSLSFDNYNFHHNDFISFMAHCLRHLPESIVNELLISLRGKIAEFSKNDWKAVVHAFSIHDYLANRSLIHFLIFHTDAPTNFIHEIGLRTNSVNDNFDWYYAEAKMNFYGERNGINRALYEKLNLNASDLKMLKKIGTSI